MRCSVVAWVFFLACAAALAALVICPRLDLTVSGWFYQPGHGFYLANQPLFLFLHWVAVQGAWALGILLGGCALVAGVRQVPVFGFGGKSWLFLFLALLIGPVLIANVGLKDHWGRARPRDVVEFGGTSFFSPALSPQPVTHENGSFVSGDGSFGFFLPCLAYVVPLTRRELSRRVFWVGMVVGGFFGFARLAMGAHFLSDTLFAGLLMLFSAAGLHALMFGARTTAAYWREWMFISRQ